MRTLVTIVFVCVIVRSIGMAQLHHFTVQEIDGESIPSQTAGIGFFIQIIAQDSSNNPVTSFTGNVGITSDGNIVEGGGLSPSFVAGILDTHRLVLSSVGNFSITVQNADGTETGTSNSFVVGPGPVDHFLVESSSGGTIPAQTVGTTFTIRVVAQDVFDNTATGFTGTVNLTSNGSLTLGGGTTPSFSSGILSSRSMRFGSGGSFNITATATGGTETGTSNNFTVNNVVPSTLSLAPASRGVGTAGFTISVTGSNFVPTSVVRFNGSARSTTFIDSAHVTAEILSSDLTTAGSFPITVFTPAPGGGASNVQTFTVQQFVANARVFLQGSFMGSDMRVTLRNAGLVPLNQPYGTSPWNYNGTESVGAIPVNVVDWVLVELRSSTNQASTVARRAAFVRNTGSITDLDGTSLLRFSGIAEGSYYIVVRHRNHIPVMSATPVTISTASNLYDFTTATTQFFGDDAARLSGNRFGLYAGDYSIDGFIDSDDFIGPDNEVFQSGYRQSDTDMDGFVDGDDFIHPDNNVFRGSHVPN